MGFYKYVKNELNLNRSTNLYSKRYNNLASMYKSIIAIGLIGPPTQNSPPVLYVTC